MTARAKINQMRENKINDFKFQNDKRPIWFLKNFIQVFMQCGTKQ